MDYDSTIQDKFEFHVSLRFELPCALRLLTDPKTRIHRAWRDAASAAMPKSFHDDFATLGGMPAIWLLLPDVLAPLPPETSFEQFRAELSKLPAPELRRRLLMGLLQDEQLTRDVLDGEDLAHTLNSSTRANTWLTTVGLFPASKNTPFVLALQRIIGDPKELVRPLLRMVDTFWTASFQSTWSALEAPLRQSAATTERFFRSCSLKEFAHTRILRVEVDERARELRPTRCEERIPFTRVKIGYVYPSAFNALRTWTLFEDRAGTVIHLSCFDPAIDVR
jgi:hypothetical protein